MNCYNHPAQTAVAQCPDCGKGLCPECAAIYSILICNSCNKSRIRRERNRLIKELLTIFIGGAILTFLFAKLLSMPVGENNHTVPLDTISYLILYYMCSGVITGWQTLTKITPRMFVVLPIIGWLIYFILKLSLSFWVGLVMLPIRTIRSIIRLVNLQKIST